MLKHGPVHAIPSFTVKVRGEVGCAVLSSFALVAEQARCYLSTRPGAVVDVVYSEHCGRCGVSGEVSKRRTRVMFSRRPCPVCKGFPVICSDAPIQEIR